MPRGPVATENTEDLMSDVAYEDWQEAAVELGTKLLWPSIGTVFVGVFRGIEIIPLDDENDGFTNTPAATFTDLKTGEMYWSWMPFTMRRVLMGLSAVKVSPGDTVRIEYLGDKRTSSNPDYSETKQFSVKVAPKK